MYSSLSVVTAIIAIGGLIVIGIVALRPRTFWLTLVFINVGTLGLVVRGYGLVDEFLTGCVLIGGFLAVSIKAVPLTRQPRNKLASFHAVVFSLMIIYVIVESTRGLMLWGDLRLVRWVVYYVMLGIILLTIHWGIFPVPDARKTALTISLSALIYFIAYLGQGVYLEALLGESRFITQGEEWSGSAYAVFPIIVAIPAAIYLLKDKARKWQLLGLALIAMGVLVAYYYDSRISYLVIAAFLVFSPLVLRFRRVAPFLVVLLGVLGWLYYFGNWNSFVGHAQDLAQGLTSTVNLWSPRISDIDRYAHIFAAFDAVGDNLVTWLFGYGVHSHRFVMGPYLNEIYASIPGVNINIPNTVRTEGFEALLVDTGFVGLFLLAANFLFAAMRLLTQRSTLRILLLLALVMSFLWLFVANIQDVLLFYMIIMPVGPLVLMGQRKTATKTLYTAD